MSHEYNKVRDIKAGLEIFERRGGTHCAAGHDVFCAGQAVGAALTPDEIATLYAAGWMIWMEGCMGCAEEGDTGAHCDPDEPEDERRWHAPTCREWAIFT